MLEAGEMAQPNSLLLLQRTRIGFPPQTRSTTICSSSSKGYIICFSFPQGLHTCVHRHTMQVKHSMHIEIKLIKKKRLTNLRPFSSSKKKTHSHEFAVHHSGFALTSDHHLATFCGFPHPDIW